MARGIRTKRQTMTYQNTKQKNTKQKKD